MPARPRRMRKRFTASVHRMDVHSRDDAQVQRKVRQNWQIQAWTYRDSLPEVRYATEFRAHCASRMRIFVGVLPDGDKSAPPVDIHDPTLGVPADVITACDNALLALGNGRLALSKVMSDMSQNWDVAGEGFLLAIPDNLSGSFNYSIRSISEVVVEEDQILLREGPMTNQGLLGLVELPAGTMATRMWNPHPQYHILADSPMRALLDTCEDLMIMRRMIRAIGRNRIAGRGLLFMPSEADLPIFNNDDDSISGESWLDSFTESLISPIRNEGDASAVVPNVTEMSADLIEKVRFLEFGSSFDAEAAKIRDELVSTLATGLDLPKEILIGMADLNHWTAFQVSADMFRYHIEPHVINLVSALTDGHLRPYVAATPLQGNVVEPWMNRIVVWFDPTDLVTPPDLSASALALHGALALSDEAARRYLGFSENDAPDTQEIMMRMVRNARTWPANAQLGLLHQLNPALTIPPIDQAGTIPGVKGATPNDPGGVVAPALPAAPEPARPSSPSPSGDSGPHGPAPSVAPTPGAPAASPPSGGITAAGNRQLARLGTTLMLIDRDLRTKLQVAVNEEMMRQLRRLGDRLRSKVAKNDELRSKIATTHNEHVALKLGSDVVKASGLTSGGMLQTDWAELKDKFMTWTSAAQRRALQVAASVAGSSDARQVMAATDSNSSNLERAWEVMKSSLDAIASSLIHNPDPNISEDDLIASLEGEALVPTGVVRCAVGIAGGSSLSDWTETLFHGASVPSVPSGVFVGGVASGATIQNLITSSGTVVTGYEWVHGPSDRPFDPHLDLDGVVVQDFTDDQLQNEGDWPPVAFYCPGDHAGCLCDFSVQYGEASDESGDDLGSLYDSVDAGIADAISE